MRYRSAAMSGYDDLDLEGPTDRSARGWAIGLVVVGGALTLLWAHGVF